MRVKENHKKAGHCTGSDTDGKKLINFRKVKVGHKAHQSKSGVIPKTLKSSATEIVQTQRKECSPSPLVEDTSPLCAPQGSLVEDTSPLCAPRGSPKKTPYITKVTPEGHEAKEEELKNASIAETNTQDKSVKLDSFEKNFWRHNALLAIHSKCQR